jgi:recombination protein RecA
MKEDVKALEEAVAKLNKDYGKGSLINMSKTKSENVPVISSGSFGLDIATGIGGYPIGRVIELSGPESSGKTTLAIHAITQAQKTGGVSVFIDAEHSFDRVYAQNLGVDLKNLWISQPDYGEQGWITADRMARLSKVNLIVVDSIPMMTPKAEIDGDAGDSFMGLNARLVGQALRKLVPLCSSYNTTLILINQIREKMGVSFGSPETTPGGRAPRHLPSMRIDVRRIGAVKDGDTEIGNRTRVKVKKNKMAAPALTAEFDLLFGKGINYEGEIIDKATELSIVKRSGAWYSYDTTKLGQGRDKAVDTLRDNPELTEELVKKILDN